MNFEEDKIQPVIEVSQWHVSCGVSSGTIPVEGGEESRIGGERTERGHGAKSLS